MLNLSEMINARPSYSHLKIENLGAVRHLEFKVGGFQLLRGLRVPVMNQHTKFGQNPTVHG